MIRLNTDEKKITKKLADQPYSPVEQRWSGTEILLFIYLFTRIVLRQGGAEPTRVVRLAFHP